VNARRPSTPARVAIVVLGLVLMTSCNDSSAPDGHSAGPSPQPTHTSKVITPGPGCSIPSRHPTPSWVPDRLPLPPDTYFYAERPAKKGFHNARFVMRISAAAFGRFARSRWRTAGVVLSRPDSEPGEVESLFTSPFGVGLFKANDVLCEPRYTRLILIFQF
jgi:hypothetical protein